MDVTVLGSSGTYASTGDACAGYLFQVGGFRFLVDIGPGVLANLQRHCALTELDAVVITHAHPDHWLDLAGLRNALKYVFHRSGLEVLAPGDMVAQANGLIGADDASTLLYREVADGAEVPLGPVVLRFSATDHPGETLAVRVDDGSVTAIFSADTGPGWSPTEFGVGCDLALIESTYTDDNLPAEAVLHLTASQAGAKGREVAARRLVTTHFLPGTDRQVAAREATATFGQPVTTATPHLTVAL
jgi:ribonuclease BN (tRNA processing enzyme)